MTHVAAYCHPRCTIRHPERIDQEIILAVVPGCFSILAFVFLRRVFTVLFWQTLPLRMHFITTENALVDGMTAAEIRWCMQIACFLLCCSQRWPWNDRL